MKKMCYVLVVSMLFTILSSLNAFALRGSSYYRQDFQLQTDYTSLANDNWSSTNGNNVSIQSEGTNKYLNINSSWSNETTKNFSTPLTGIVTIEMNLAINDPSLQYLRLVNNSGTPQNLVFFHKPQPLEGNKMIFASGTWLELAGSISNNEWVQMKLTVNTATNKCSMWLNSQPVFTNYSISDLGGSLKGIQFYYAQLYGAVGGDLKIDDMNVFEEIIEVNDDFTSAANWYSVDGWSTNNGSPLSIGVEGANKFWKINGLWGNESTRVFPSPLKGEIVLEMKLKMDYPIGQYLRVEDNTGVFQNFLFFHKPVAGGTNQIIFANGAWVALPDTFNDNTWINLKLIFNTTTNKCDLYMNDDVYGNGVEKSVFKGYDTAAFGAIKGIQFHYPVYYYFDPNSGRDFCIDDVKATIYNQYSTDASIFINEQKIETGAALFSGKNNPARIEILANRMNADALLTGDIYYTLYDQNKLIDIKKETTQFALNDYENQIQFNMDLSNVVSSDLQVKIFFWENGNLRPYSACKQIWSNVQ